VEHADELPHRTFGGLGWHEVLDLDLDLVTDPDAMAPAILDILDGGGLDAEHLADQRRQHGHRPAELAGEDRPELLGLLLGRGGVHEHPDPPVAIGHQRWGVGQDGHGQAADIDVLDPAVVDVEDQHHPASVVVGRHGQPRGGARAHHVAGAVLEVPALQLPRHQPPPALDPLIGRKHLPLADAGQRRTRPSPAAATNHKTAFRDSLVRVNA
jgi:hypothetical protein